MCQWYEIAFYSERGVHRQPTLSNQELDQHEFARTASTVIAATLGCPVERVVNRTIFF